MTFIAYALMFTLTTSGSSRFLALVSVAIIIVFAVLQSPLWFYRPISFGRIVYFFFLFLFSTVLCFALPADNATRFLMSFFYLAGSTLLWAWLTEKPQSYQAAFFETSLKIFLLGSAIQFSTVFGEQMEVYKSVVQHPMLSNLDREGLLSIFDKRYFGFFSEPSYFAVFYSLFCAGLFLTGSTSRALFYFILGFALCPSPNFLIGIVLIIFVYRSSILSVPRRALLGILTIITLYALLGTRFANIISDIELFISGGFALTSFSQRVILPFMDMVSFVGAGKFFLPYMCVIEETCPLSFSRVPLMTFSAFFSIIGLLLYILFAKLLAHASLFSVLLLMVLGSSFAGGGGFMPQFAMVLVSSLFILGFETRFHLEGPALNRPE